MKYRGMAKIKQREAKLKERGRMRRASADVRKAIRLEVKGK